MRERLAWAGCIVLALVRSWQSTWICDDAFIVFRYAQNLVEGRGLVFNPGERVEGYSDFLWTLYAALGLAVGANPETWVVTLGALSYLGIVGLLIWIHGQVAARLGAPRMVVPFGALAAAAMPDLAVHAVSGLETTCFTFLALAGFAALLVDKPKLELLAGVAFGAAALTRPEGVLFGVAAIAWLLVTKRYASAMRVSGILLAFFGAQMIFRVAYYGDLMPNTYYAKSGGSAWWGQGLHYLWLFVLRYPPIALAPFAAFLAPRKIRPIVFFALLLGGVHAAWVVRVGGDFMFARFFVPATPFFLVAMDATMLRWSAERRPAIATAVVAGAFVFAFAFIPIPIIPGMTDRGIIDERGFYTPERGERADLRAAAVAPFLEGTGARVAFYGSEARFVYRARIPVAIESATGLTDRVVARQEMPKRGRIGHEKLARPGYLIDERRAHLVFYPRGRALSHLDTLVPQVFISINGIQAELLQWDPVFLDQLRARGVQIPDYPHALDEAIEKMSKADFAIMAAQSEHFYFRYVDDGPRRARIAERLAHDAGGDNPAPK